VGNILTSVPSKKEKLPLSVTHPELAKEAEGWDPSEFTFGSHRKVMWKCNKGHVYEATIGNRALRKSNCPFCSGYKVLAGFNDLATTHPELASEADGWDPSSLNAGSNKKVRWRCARGHNWSAVVASRGTGQKSNCPVCIGKKVLAGFNDIATTHPSLASEADGWDPSSLNAGSNKKVSWRCARGHNWSTSVTKRAQRDYGCPYCSGKRVLTGFNDLATTHPELALEMIGGDARKISKGSDRKFSWLCPNGHNYSASVSHRVGNRGCPSCAKSGFDPNQDGFLYFLKHGSWKMLQIGITNFPDDRLDRHKRSGWQTLEVRGPMDGHLAMQWETAILRMLKAKGADLANEKIAGKFDGYSEAWSKSTYGVKSIKELMQLTEEFEENQ
jgi:hypothetical protein